MSVCVCVCVCVREAGTKISLKAFMAPTSDQSYLYHLSASVHCVIHLSKSRYSIHRVAKSIN